MHGFHFQPNIDWITSSRVRLRRRAGTTRTGLCIAAIALALIAPVAAMADTVSGRIYGQDEKPAANMTFTAKPAKGETVEFKTNASGAFSVYLDAGRYTVSPSGDASIQGVINSYPQPVQQDVHLKKGGT